MQEGAEHLDKNIGIQIEAISTEDEKEVNTKALKKLFLDNMQAMLEEEAFNQWKLKVSEDERVFTMKDGDQKVVFEYQADGFSLTMEGSEPESVELMLNTLSVYQNAYNQIHPKTSITFELTCTDEDEAKAIIKKASKMDPPIAISKLKFYSDEPGGEPTNKDELLEKIRKELAAKKKPSKK